MGAIISATIIYVQERESCLEGCPPHSAQTLFQHLQDLGARPRLLDIHPAMPCEECGSPQAGLPEALTEFPATHFYSGQLRASANPTSDPSPTAFPWPRGSGWPVAVLYMDQEEGPVCP